MTTAFEISMSPAVDAPPSDGAAVDLYWLPLGAGGRSVRFNGLVFEAIAARLQHRTRSDLYHSALEVRVGSDRYVIEMAPVWNDHARDRGVVSEGAVASRRLGRLRLFRYQRFDRRLVKRISAWSMTVACCSASERQPAGPSRPRASRRAR